MLNRLQAERLREGGKIGALLLSLLGYTEADENSDIGASKTSHHIRIDVHPTPRGSTRVD